MSTHIAANEGEIAELVLLPGDPLRAQFAAEHFLENAVCYTKIRGMLGFTGTYKGKRVSVQGTGMGQPSLAIYATELFQYYNVQKAIRVGTCGGLLGSVNVCDIILAEGACSDSAMLNHRFGNLHFAPIADFTLLETAHRIAQSEKTPHHIGLVTSHDTFYDTDENWKRWASYGVLGVEMETAELYTLAAQFHRQALAILTVSDHMASGATTDAETRQTGFSAMIRIALETITA